VKRYNLSKDTYTLKFSDDSWEEITFDDVMKLIPKSWWQKEARTSRPCRVLLSTGGKGDNLWSFKSKYSCHQFHGTNGLEYNVDVPRSGVLDENCET